MRRRPPLRWGSSSVLSESFRISRTFPNLVLVRLWGVGTLTLKPATDSPVRYPESMSKSLNNLKPTRWSIGRLIITRYRLYRETLVGVIFTHEHSYRRTVEIMTGRSNYVFYFADR